MKKQIKNKFSSKPEFKKSAHFIIKMIVNWIAAMVVGWTLCRWYVLSFGGKFPPAGIFSERLLGLIQDLGGGAFLIALITILWEIFRRRGNPQ